MMRKCFVPNSLFSIFFSSIRDVEKARSPTRSRLSGPEAQYGQAEMLGASPPGKIPKPDLILASGPEAQSGQAEM